MLTRQSIVTAVITAAAASTAVAGIAGAAPAHGIGTSTVSLDNSPLTMTVQVIDSHSRPAGQSTPNAALFNHAATVSERANVRFNGKVSGGQMVAGYLIGCQADLSSGLSLGVSPGIGLGASLGASPGSNSLSPSANLGGNISLTLAPGEVTAVKVIDATLGDHATSPYQVEHAATALNLSQCGGRASAVPFVTATLNSDAGTLQTTAYGKQFDF
ncbi:MspA family porin [Jongsikchunia kroppenstedtii]|uniref:MspA family porin n=1 Tax=Jongsikchunia kroppenstedtii TaxID=1121721 RepID=UPI00038039FA|nr:MspA family porin [Jongsikchunia kroppenstedtii]